jgi:L-ascorbate metabolism protein UlaG (beta-lactamase superfamily)
MKIKWLGHSCFLITSQAGLRVLTDPYHSDDGLKYGQLNEAADVVLVSHDHFDHNNVGAVSGSPLVVREAGKRKAKGISIVGWPAWHDTSGGRKRGQVTMFVFDMEGLRLCHLGDLGQDLDPLQAGNLGKVDILFAPVGGFFTIDGAAVDRLCLMLNPKVLIPMHYKTPKVDFPIAGVENYLRGKSNVSVIDRAEIELIPENMPTSTRIIVLQSFN